MRLLRWCKYFIISLFIIISLSVAVLQIPYVHKIIVRLVISKVDNQYFKVNFKDFRIKRLTNIEISNVKIQPIIINSKEINIGKISFKIDPISILLDNKLTLEDIILKDIEISTNKETINKVLNTKKMSTNNAGFLKKFTIVFRNLKFDNFVVNYSDGKGTLKFKLNTDIKDIGINKKNILFNVNSLSLENEKISISNLSGNISYYFVSDSINCTNLTLLSNHINFIGNVHFSKIKDIIRHNFNINDINFNIDANELLLQTQNISKILDNKLLKKIKNIEIRGKMYKDEHSVYLKNIFFKYKNNTSVINLNAKNINNPLRIKYDLNIKNGFSIVNLILNAISDKLPNKISSNHLIDVNFYILGNNNISNGDIIISDFKNTIHIKTHLKTKLENIAKWNINDIIEKININASTKNFISEYVNGLSVDDGNLSLNYNQNGKETKFKFKLDNISYKKLKLNNVNYEGIFKNNNISGNIELLNNNIKILGKNEISLQDLFCKLEGKIFMNKLHIARLDISNFSSKFSLDINKNNEKYELQNLFNDIKMYVNDVEVTENNIKTFMIYKDGLINTSITSSFADVKANNVNIKAVINDIKRLKLKLLKNENEITKNNNYDTLIKINVKRINPFNLIFYDIVDPGKINIEANISNNDGFIKNKITLDVNGMLFLNSNLNLIKANISNSIDNNGKISSFIDIKCNGENKEINFNSNVSFANEVIKSEVKLDINKENLLDTKFNIDIKDKAILDFDNKKNYLRLLNKRIITNGICTYVSKKLTFDNLLIFDKNKKITYLNVNGQHNFDIEKFSSKLNILINNITLDNVNIPYLRDIKCKISGKINTSRNKIKANILLKDLKIHDINYKNIQIAANTIFINNKNDNIYNILVKQYDIISQKAIISGQIFHSKSLSFSLKVILKDFELINLNPILKNIIDIKSGLLTVNYELKGDINNVLLNGNGTIKGLGLKVINTGCYYNEISSDIFSFNSNEIGLYSIKAYQNGSECGNFNSSLFFKTIFKPHFNLEGNFYNCNILNKEKGSKHFYGSINGDGNILLNFNGKELVINSKIKISDGNLYIFSGDDTTEDIEISTSKIHILNKIYKKQYSTTKNNLSFDIEFDKNTNVNLKLSDYNSLDLQGSGDISIKLRDNLKLNGNYIVDNGTYNINIGKFLTKKFKIKSAEVNFNNIIQYSNINATAVSDIYDINIDNKKSKVFLEVTLNGNLYSPNIDYNIIFADSTMKPIKKDLKKFLSILFFNNFDSNQLSNSASTFINNFCSKMANSLNKNLTLNINCNLIDIFLNQSFKNLNFDIKYKLNDIITMEKTFDFSSFKNLCKNQNININSKMKNNMIQNIGLFRTNKDKNSFSNSENIISYNLTKSYNF